MTDEMEQIEYWISQGAKNKVDHISCFALLVIAKKLDIIAKTLDKNGENHE